MSRRTDGGEKISFGFRNRIAEAVWRAFNKGEPHVIMLVTDQAGRRLLHTGLVPMRMAFRDDNGGGSTKLNYPPLPPEAAGEISYT